MPDFELISGVLGLSIFHFLLCLEALMNQSMSMRPRRNMWQTLWRCASTTHERGRCIAKGVLSAGFIILALAGGCQMTRESNPAKIAGGATVTAVDMDSSLEPTTIDGPVMLSAAKNEWVSFAVRIGKAGPMGEKPTLQLHVSPAIAAENFSAYQVLPMPVDTNRAGYVRQTGLAAGTKELPRALLPLVCR